MVRLGSLLCIIVTGGIKAFVVALVGYTFISRVDNCVLVQMSFFSGVSGLANGRSGLQMVQKCL